MADPITLERLLHDARRDELVSEVEADRRKWRIVTHRHVLASGIGLMGGISYFLVHRLRVIPALRMAAVCKLAEIVSTRVNFEVVRQDGSWHPGEHHFSYFQYNPFASDEVNMVTRRELSYRCEVFPPWYDSKLSALSPNFFYGATDHHFAVRGLSSLLNGVAIGCVIPLLLWRPSGGIPTGYLAAARSRIRFPKGIRIE